MVNTDFFNNRCITMKICNNAKMKVLNRISKFYISNAIFKNVHVAYISVRFALSCLFPHILRCHDISFSFICTLSGHFFLVLYQNVFNRKLYNRSNFISNQNIIIDVIDESTPWKRFNT